MGYSILIIYGERFSPISLTAKYSISKTIIHLHFAYTLFFYEFLCFGDGVLYFHAIEIEFVRRGVDHLAAFGVKTLLTHIRSFYKRNYRQVEMLCKSIVTAVMSRHCHYSARTIT